MKSFNRLLAMWRDSFSPLGLRPLRLYLGGQAVSLIGTYLQLTAQSLLVYQLSNGSASALGIIALLTALPSLILSVWIGKVIAQFDRRKLIIIVNASEMILAFMLGWLVQTGQAQLWHVYVMTFVVGALNAFLIPAQTAFVADLVGTEKVRDSINLGAMIHNMSRAVGPALAGFAINAYGLTITFWLNGLSFLAVIISMSMIRASRHQVQETSPTELPTLAHGVRFIWQHHHIRDVLLAFALLALCGQGVYAIVPALVLGDATQTGSLLGAAGAGSLVSVLLVMPFVNRIKRMGLVLSVGVVWMGLWLMLLAQSVSFALSLLSIFMAGIATTVVWDGSLGLLQVIPPNAMKAQMLNLFGIVSNGFMPIASLLLSYLADRTSPALTVMLSGVTMVLLSALMLSRRYWRDWNIQSPTLSPETSVTEAQVMTNR